MRYFNTEFTKFLKDLVEHNNKEWFHSNKARYEKHVKIPFASFVSALISEIQKIDKTLKVEAKDCILRINRDIRFAKDKTPYNTHLTAIISSAGKKDKSIPGLFIRISPEKITLIGGCYNPDKNQLINIRQAIENKNKTFRKIITEAAFQKTFKEIKGEKMKRIPKEWQSPAEKEPYVLHKQFYYMTEEKIGLLTSDKLLNTIMGHYKVMLPMNTFLAKAIL